MFCFACALKFCFSLSAILSLFWDVLCCIGIKYCLRWHKLVCILISILQELKKSDRKFYMFH
jgi:hypothetical protein